MNNVICVGAIVADIVLYHVDKLPSKGNLLKVTDATWNTGGCALNCAIDLSRLGVHTTLIGTIGKDILGDWLVGKCSEENIDYKNIITKDINTSFSVVGVSSEGERSILHYAGANSYLSMKEIDFNIFKNTKYLYLGGVYGLGNFDKTISEFMYKAKLFNPNLQILLDVIYDDNIKGDSLIQDSFKYVDFFMPNYNEAQNLSQKNKLKDIAEYFIHKGIKNVIITLGKEGLFFANKYKSYIVKSEKVNSIDTTGAGDAFASGLIWALVNDYDVDKSVKIGNSIAAISTTEIGASNGIYKFNKLKELINKNYL